MKKFIFFILCLIGIYYLYSYAQTIELEEETEVKEVDNTRYLECMSNKDSSTFLSDDFKELENELNDTLKQYGNNSVIYDEINSDYEFKYNEDEVYYGASTIKAPFAISIYKEAESNPEILDKVLHYTSKYYIGGTGEIQYHLNTKKDYTIRELIKYMIEDSDNIAYYMLLDEFDKYKSKKEWNALGSTTTFTGGDKFSMMNALDANIYMNELYKYLNTNTKLSKELGEVFKNASKNSIIKKNVPYNVYFKYGWYSVYYHEMTIISQDNPYTLVILTSAYSRRETIMKKVTELTLKMHIQHWNDLMNSCIKYYNV
jgi:hypothetical protein